MKRFFLFILTIFIIIPLYANKTSDDDNEKKAEEEKVKYITTAKLIVTWPPQALSEVTESFRLPFMRFNHPLTKDNNLTFKLGAELSPITLEGKFGIVWTPLAFLEFYAESKIGSGWKLWNLIGTGINENNSGKRKSIPLNFTNAVYSYTLGGAFQFDLGAVLPHKWTHVVFRTDQFTLYRALSSVTNETSWIYQNDYEGSNRNGWQYGASYVIGYQMPLFLNLVGIKIDTQKKLFPSPKGLNNKKWGEDIIFTTFGPIFNFTIKKHYNILLLAQWYTYPVYLNSNPLNNFYQTNVINPNRKTESLFYQIGVVFTFTYER